MILKSLIFILFFVSCGSGMILNSRGVNREIRFGEARKIWEDNYQAVETIDNPFGEYGSAQNEAFVNYPPDRPLHRFSIVTYYTFWDVLMSAIPFYSQRTVVFSGKYLPFRSPDSQ